MIKLSSFFIKKGSKLHLTSFLTSLPTIMLNNNKPHISTNGQSVDKLKT